MKKVLKLLYIAANNHYAGFGPENDSKLFAKLEKY